MASSSMTRSEARKELGLSSRSSKSSEKDIIKAAYRKRSLETHPDKGGNSEDFIRVAQAYEVLTTKNNNKDGGMGSGDSSSDGETSTSTMSKEEQLQWAEDQFFKLFDDVMDEPGAAADAVVDWLFPKDDKTTHTNSSWATRQTQAMTKWFIRKAMKWIQSLLESENTTIQMEGGRVMTGAEFKQMRVKSRERREGRIAKTAQETDL